MTDATTSLGSERLARGLGLALLGFALAGLTVGLVREMRSGDAAAVATPASARATTVYYFHAHTRCDTCLAIERQTAEVIAREFTREIEAGTLVFSIIDFDKPEFRHFREKYILSFGAVVVAQPNEGPWEVLNDVWTLVDEDRAAFDAYLTDRIRSHITSTGPAPR